MAQSTLAKILEDHQLDVLSYPTRYSCICQRREPSTERMEWPASKGGYHAWAEHVAAIAAASVQTQEELF